MSIDDTADLSMVHAVTPAQITETTEAATLKALLDAVEEHAKRIRKLVRTRDRAGTHERIHGAIADLQQLDAHLADAERHVAAEDYEGVMKRVHGEDPHTAAVAAVHEVIEDRKHGGGHRATS